MSAVSLLFPNQLFENNPALKTGQPVFVVEEFLFFNQYKFHKQKLVFHRAGMKAYCSYLESNGFTVDYIEAHEKNADVRNLIPWLKEQHINEIHYINVNELLSRQST